MRDGINAEVTTMSAKGGSNLLPAVALKKAETRFKVMDLPSEILEYIISLVARCDKSDDTNNESNSGEILSESFVLNHVPYGDSFADLLSLSSTCSRLRTLVGPVIFKTLSLIRANQLDVVLESPREFEKFSDRRRYQREFLKEVLDVGFRECAQADLAKSCFREGLIGDRDFHSRYQKIFSINNFISYLECDNSFLMSTNLSLFKNVITLKVLDEAPRTFHSQLAYRDFPQNLKVLTVNASTLVKLLPFNDVIKHLRRLDILCDLNEFHVKDMLALTAAFESQRCDIRSFNMYINDSALVTYVEVFNLFHSICRGCSQLENISMRITKRKSFQISNQNWNIQQDPRGCLTLRFLDSLRDLTHINHITLDIGILNAFIPPSDLNTLIDNAYSKADWQSREKSLCISIVDVSLSVPEFSPKILGLVKYMCLILGASILDYRYGEVVEQSQIQALNLVTRVAKSLVPASALDVSMVDIVNIEKCWSVSDDTILRDYYYRIFEDYKLIGNKSENSGHTSAVAKLNTVDPSHRSMLNSPRYRVHESFIIHNSGRDGSNHDWYLAPVIHLDTNDEVSNTASRCRSPAHPCCNISSMFWSAQTSLMELEHYSLKRKQLSKIWSL